MAAQDRSKCYRLAGKTNENKMVYLQNWKKRIWIILELAKKPVECLEYIVVHEMFNLLKRHHNDRFLSLIEKYMPQWKFYKDALNRLPVSHGEWEYWWSKNVIDVVANINQAVCILSLGRHLSNNEMLTYLLNEPFLKKYYMIMKRIMQELI